LICNELNLIKKYDSIGTNITLDDYVVDRVRVFEIVERKLIVLPCVVLTLKSNRTLLILSLNLTWPAPLDVESPLAQNLK